MGLDMYLTANMYISEDSNVGFAAAAAEHIPELAIEGCSMRNVNVRIGYWRKANAIHKWFVDNVQGGDDDCRDYYVDREQLGELKALCNLVLAHPELAAETLPPSEGFFFGSQEIDDFYFDDLRKTVETIERAEQFSDNWDLQYHSSW